MGSLKFQECSREMIKSPFFQFAALFLLLLFFNFDSLTVASPLKNVYAGEYTHPLGNFKKKALFHIWVGEILFRKSFEKAAFYF